MSKCRVCNNVLTHENWAQGNSKSYNYICKNCHALQNRAWVKANPEKARKHARIGAEKYRRKNGVLPMSENRKCSSFLGVNVAEQLLSYIFKNVQRMPYGNPGYDFRCGRGYLVDVKSSCRRAHTYCADDWLFQIKKNPIAEYFLCLAFDNRDDLTPEHIWLIPAGDVNNKVGVSISETTLDKWNKYEQPLDKVISCCNTLRGE